MLPACGDQEDEGDIKCWRSHFFSTIGVTAYGDFLRPGRYCYWTARAGSGSSSGSAANVAAAGGDISRWAESRLRDASRRAWSKDSEPAQVSETRRLCGRGAGRRTHGDLSQSYHVDDGSVAGEARNLRKYDVRSATEEFSGLVLVCGGYSRADSVGCGGEGGTDDGEHTVAGDGRRAHQLGDPGILAREYAGRREVAEGRVDAGINCGGYGGDRAVQRRSRYDGRGG